MVMYTIWRTYIICNKKNTNLQIQNSQTYTECSDEGCYSQITVLRDPVLHVESTQSGIYTVWYLQLSKLILVASGMC